MATRKTNKAATTKSKARTTKAATKPTKATTTKPKKATTNKPKPKATKPKADTSKDANPNRVFGKYTRLAVLRAMGKAGGFDFAAATKVFEALGIETAAATIRLSLRQGVTGSKGEPAPLTKQELAQLKKLAK